MLAKILKYEFKTTARIFGLMYAGLVVLAGVNALVLLFQQNQDSGILAAASAILLATFVLLAIGVFAATFIIIIIRFYRLLGDEGYLWFTLPPTAGQHIVGKFIVAFIWSTASGLMVIASVLIVTLPLGWTGQLHLISQGWNELVAMGFNANLLLFASLILALFSGVSGILMLYTAMAIGPVVTKSRFAGSVIACIIIYFVVQAVNIIPTIAMMVPVAPLITDEALMTAGVDSLEMIQIAGYTNQVMLISLVAFGALYIALSVVFFLLTRYFITKKLNLA